MDAIPPSVLRETTDAEEEVRIKFVDEIFRIEVQDSTMGNGWTEEGGDEGEARMKKPDCNYCKV